ncbi:MAG: hypothetical protein M5U09_02110 [Gammaproteobacteria bacterium]|nr:hypothetical protein [Gammaproteobacteria bacterium]
MIDPFAIRMRREHGQRWVKITYFRDLDLLATEQARFPRNCSARSSAAPPGSTRAVPTSKCTSATRAARTSPSTSTRKWSTTCSTPPAGRAR